MKNSVILLLLMVATLVYSQDDPFMEATYKKATLVNTTTNSIEDRTEGLFYVAFFSHAFCYVEGGIVDKYKVIDSKEDDFGVTMILRNDKNQKCGLRYEMNRLILTNTFTHKAVILSEPYYHSDENDVKFESYPNRETLQINYYSSYKVNKYDIRYDIQSVFIKVKIDFESESLIMKEGDSEAHYKIKDVKSNEQYITFFMYNNYGYTVVSIDKKDCTLCLTSTKKDPFFLKTNR